MTICGSANAEPGFHPLSSDVVPTVIKAAADSVFEIHVLNAQAHLTVNLKSEREAFEQKIRSAHLKANIEKLIRFQMQFCIDHNFSESCDIYTDTSQGTAFLLEDGKTLWTNYHVVDDYVSSLAERFHRPKWIAKLTLEQQNLPIFIFDKDGRLVFATAKDADRATVSVKPFKLGLTVSLSDVYDESSDFVQIQVSHEIGKPLALAKKDPQTGDRIYIVGYPVATGPFVEQGMDEKHLADLHTRSPQPDSEGNGLRVSVGQALPIESGITDRQLSDQEIWEWKRDSMFGLTSSSPDYYQLFFSNADTVFGSSGGPILNVEGKVVGMNAGGKTSKLRNGSAVEILERGVRLTTVLKKLRGDWLK